MPAKQIKAILLLLLLPILVQAQSPCNLSNYAAAYVLSANDYPYTSPGSGITVTVAAPGVPTLGNSSYDCGGNTFATASPSFWLVTAAQQITLTFSVPVSSITVVFNGTGATEEFYFASNSGPVTVTNFCTDGWTAINNCSGLAFSGSGSTGNIATLNVPGGATEFYLTHNGLSAGSRIALLDCFVPATGGGGGGGTVIDPITDIAVCSGASVPASSFTSTPSGASFDWTNSNPSIGLAVSGTGNTPTFVATNPTSTPITSTVTVTSPVSGCATPVTPVTYTITVNPGPTIDAGTDQTVCDGAQVTLSGSGAGTGGTYIWDNGITNGMAFTAPSGTTTYTVTGTDASGCVNTDEVDVSLYTSPTIDAGTDQTVCDDGTQVTLSGSGAGTGGTYIWDNGITDGMAFTAPSGTTTYNVTGTDANGCENTDQVDVVVSPLPTIDAGTDQLVCNGGQVTLSGSGAGTGGTYIWDNGIADGVAFTAPSGTTTYTVTGTDANGCENTDQVDVSLYTSLTINAGTDQAVCDDGSQVTLTGSGAGTGGTYTWDNGITDGIAFTPPSGTTTYTVTGTDAGGCVNTDQVDVTVNPLPTIDNISPIDASCSADDGTISVLTSGGAGPYSYALNNGQTSNNGTFLGLTDANYTVTVTDANGCVANQSTTIGKATGPTAAIVNSFDASCYGKNDGSAEVSATGGTTPYTYNWSPVGGSDVTATGLAPGTYTVVIKDASGCPDQVQITISEPNALAVVETITHSDCGLDNGEISLAVSGGTGNYTYNWDPNVSTTDNATNLAVGTYKMTVTDANGCAQTISYTINEINAFYTEAIPDIATILQGQSTDLHLFIDPNTIVDTIIWSPSKGLSCSDCKDPIATPEFSTTYIVTVTNDNGCTSIDTVKINVILPCADVFVPNTFSPNEDGLNDLQCVLGECIVSLDFIIFDRWGETVFHSIDQKECWDGTFRGKIVQSGVFVYKLKATLESGEVVEESGNVTVVR